MYGERLAGPSLFLSRKSGHCSMIPRSPRPFPTLLRKVCSKSSYAGDWLMPSVDLFAEDRAHELFITAVIDRISREGHITPRINVRSAVGGHGRALAELRTYQRAVQKRLAGLSPPDLLVVVIDANCSGPGAAKAAIHKDLEADAA